MEEKKEKFYVFLDFDGVLYDMEDIINKAKNKSDKVFSFSKDSIEALNTLMTILSNDYDPELVITSTWRVMMPYALRSLKKNGFDFKDYTVSKTESCKNPLTRGKEIVAYLQDKPNAENFVIIDDGIFDFPKYFSKDRLIRTGIVGDRLNMAKVNKFLRKHNINGKKAAPQRDSQPQAEI